jgi:protein-tyrosine phosphatase
LLASRASRFSAALCAALLIAGVGCGPERDLYAGMDPMVKKRHLALEGAPNFRDLGGYATEDGRTVKWGLLYRSDNLAHLTDRDLARVNQLGIKLICDFRSPEEKAEEPDRELTPPAARAELPIFDENLSATKFEEALRSGELDDVDLREALTNANRRFATDFAPQYAAMFDRIMKPENLPAVVHCSAGKDRAGFASAVILRALGVPIETVYEDFLLTNHYTAEKIERTLWMIRLFSLFRVDPEHVRPVLGVERQYLEAAFGAIDVKYGSFDAYRREALGVDDAELEAFRNLVLE